MHIPYVISQGQLQDFGEPGHCLWQVSMLLDIYIVYNYSKDAQVQHLRVTEFVQNDVMPLAQWLTPCFYAQVTLHMYFHLTQETCCICIDWLNS